MTPAFGLPLATGETTHVDGYTRYKHVMIKMRDGVKLSADVFLPFATSQEGRTAPVLASLGPYGKDIHSSGFGLPKTDIYANMYKHIHPQGPDSVFELMDPIIWSKDYGYALVRVDARGVGKSEGKLDPFGLERSREIGHDSEGQDLYDMIEWIGSQPWSSGKVAMAGISYYGMVGYWAAMQKPPHLTCVLAYEAACDMYQAVRRGGVYSSNFHEHWYHNIVVPYQRSCKEGDDDKSPAASRVDYNDIIETCEYPDQGPWPVLFEARKLSDIQIPFYTAGNWTDPELHLPGNIMAFNEISSEHKWLEMHTGNHLAAFYEKDHIEKEKQFLDYFLKDAKDNGMLDVPRTRVQVRRGQDTFYRVEQSMPPRDAQSTKLFLTRDRKLAHDEPSSKAEAFEYEGLTGSVTFLSEPFNEQLDVLGSPYLELQVSTEAEDLDLFVYLRALDSEGQPVVLPGNHGEPTVSFGRGFWRLSHRDEQAQFLKDGYPKVIPTARSTVEKGKVYDVVVPLFPTSYCFDKGYKLQVEIGSVDEKGTIPPMQHTGGDRTKARFGGKNSFLSNGCLVLPHVAR